MLQRFTVLISFVLILLFNRQNLLAQTKNSIVVSEQNGIQIEKWFNYPNPVLSTTTLRFQHNRSGEDLEVMVTVYDPLGQPVANSTYQVNDSAYQVDLPPWDATSPNGTRNSPS